ncbi:hypothetical protein [Halalkalibacillus halophilus]|uniref:hypothetical protein n=1 Tax=Halalkalibacillus halophilus TaxID=392827 RepID=UPI000413C288|nr:hypothetical protein [Halalkalibacillus halophilus]
MNLFHQISVRVACAFASFLIAYLVYLVYTGFHLSDAYDLLANPVIWGVFIVYLVLASFVVEWAAIKLEDESKKMYVSLYMTAGFLVWVFGYLNVAFDSFFWYIYLVLFSSIFSVVAFIIFYFLTMYAQKTRMRPFIVGFPAILIVLTILIWNPAVKLAFESDYQNESYTASFDLFNGEEIVQIPVEEGQSYEILVNWEIGEEENPYGLKVHPTSNNLGTVEYIGENDEWHYLFESEHDGELRLIYHGKNISGTMNMQWEEVN